MKKKNIQNEILHESDHEDFLEASNMYEEYDDDGLNEDFDKDEELVQKIKQISGLKSKRLRTEIVNDELDVNVTTSNGDSVSKNRIKAHELISSLKNVSNIGSLKKVLSKAHKRTKVLETPLPTHISDKAHRVAAYVRDSKEVSKWDPIVKKNRKAEQLVFPLKQPDYSMKTATEFVKTWKPETDLEKEVAELLKTSENNLQDQKLLTQAELKGLESLSLEELKEKRAEFLKFKALQQYQEQKFKRLKKIKSKRYRKILRKEKQKSEFKDLEKMSKDDPEQFKEKMEKLEKERMKERMSLKHKNTSKWAKQQTIYGKYNLKAREEVQEQLQISKQLTKKLKTQLNDDVDEDTETNVSNVNDVVRTQNIKLENTTSKNPWISFVPVIIDPKDNDNKNLNKDEIYVKPKAYVDKDAIEAAKNQIENEDESDSDDEDDIIIDKPLNNDDDKSVDENDSDEEKSEHEEVKTNDKEIIQQSENITKKEFVEKDKEIKIKKEIDVKNILIAEENENHEIKDAEDEINDNDGKLNKVSNKNDLHLLTLSEAFADDDVVAEFRLEKKNTQDKEKVKPIDLTLPGWGDWAGAGVDPKKQKKKFKRKNYQRRRLIIKPAPHEQLRRDKDLENVIISEKKDKKIAEFQINELPHQFNSIEEFEKRISQPLGRTWNPESKYRKLVQPKVVTRVGSIIEPIEKDDVILNKKTKK